MKLRAYASIAGIFTLLAACDASSDHREDTQALTVAAAPKCDPAHPGEAMSRLVNVPITPPRLFGVADPNGGAWSGLSIDDLEATFCQSELSDEEETTISAGWGSDIDHPVVQVEYEKTTRQVDFFELNAGYEGTLDFASRPTSLDDPTKPNPFGQHKYSLAVGATPLRDGAPFLLDWDNIDSQATELFDALLYTFAPELKSTQTDCVKEGLCLAMGTGGEIPNGLFGARPLGIYFNIDNARAAQPAASTIAYFYGFPLKMTPFSTADVMLKIDDEGPIGTVTDLGDRHATCTMKLGMPFSDFVSQCIDILNDAKANAALEQKVIRAATRVVNPTSTAALDATWTLDVTGFHPNFASERFDEAQVPATAPTSELVLDSRATSRVLNEIAADGKTFTFDATAAVLGEYGRQVQAFVQAQMDPALTRHKLGDPACLLPDGGDFTTWKPAPGCTGIEQLVIPADPSGTTDPGLATLSVGFTNALSLGIQSVLKPGFPNPVFCADPGLDSTKYLQHCAAFTNGGLIDVTRSQIINVLGGGDGTKVPAGVLDRPTYLRLWMKALAKYFRAAPQHPTDLGDPKFDALTPADADVTMTNLYGSFMSVKYKNKFEFQADFLGSNVGRFIFR